MARKNGFIVSIFVISFLAIILWKSNSNLFEGLASVSMAALVIHTGYGAYQLNKRFPKRLFIDRILDLSILICLLLSILALPILALTNGLLTFFYYFVGLRYQQLLSRAKGANKKYVETKLGIEAPLILPFAAFAAGAVLMPSIFTEFMQSALLFAILVIGSIWLYFFSGVYNIPNSN